MGGKRYKRTVAFSKNSTNLFFHILTKCNLSCKHCYINPKQHGYETLDIYHIKAWLDIFAQKAKKTNLIILGGEPTLHPELAETIWHAKTVGYKSVTIDTNGYFFNSIISRVTPNDLDYFSFSLDGATRKINDTIRGKGSYDKCVSALKKSVQEGFGTSLIYTVNTLNIDELDMMVPLVKDLKIHRFFIQILGIRGRSAKSIQKGASEKLNQVSPSRWMEIVPKVAEKLANLGVKVTYPKVFLSPKEPFECAGLVADNYFIFPNGRVYRCPLCEDFPLNSQEIHKNRLIHRPKINEQDLFNLNIPEGCVMNKLIQPCNITYNKDGKPEYKIACCLLKEE